MVGKIRGFLILFFIFIGVSVGAAVLALVDLDETWSSLKTLANEAFPLVEPEEESPMVTLNENLAATQMFTDAIYEALQSGEANPDDLLTLGKLYFKSQNGDKLEDAEMDQMIDLANKTGIMDVVVNRAFEPGIPADGGLPPETGQNADDILQDLTADFEFMTTDGRLSPDELVGLLNKANETGLQQQITSMLPPGYDQTRVRTAVSNLAKSAASGKTSLLDINTLIDMFMDAQKDGRLDRRELDQITQTAERYGQ